MIGSSHRARGGASVRVADAASRASVRTSGAPVLIGGAVLLLGLSGCTSGGPRPVSWNARPDTDTISRLRIDPDGPREPAAVSIIAVPGERAFEPAAEGQDEGQGAVDGTAGESAPGAADSEADQTGSTANGPGSEGATSSDAAGSIEPPAATVQSNVPAIEFEDVLRSVESSFPLILAALEEIEIAEGQLLAAEGGFDLRAKADAQLGLQGFYENEFGKAILEQPTTVLGARVFGGYKFGFGDFPIWDGGDETNSQGQFGGGVIVPLLAGRDIDRRRLALWRARFERAQADPRVLEKRLEATRKAALSYWKWVATGQKLTIAQRLLDLAEARQSFIRDRVGIGELAEIAIDENQRLVVSRSATLVRLERSLQQAAIELSLYLRDDEGQPRLPRPEELPSELPVPRDPAGLIAVDDIDRALKIRPEIRELELEIEKIELEIEQAENDLLPTLDLGVAASQDIGDAVSDPDNKGPFELDVLVDFDLPLQRRVARGKVRALEAKLRKVERELQFTRERVVADVRAFEVELIQNFQQLDLTRQDAAYAGRLERGERDKFRIGDTDLLRVTIREQTTADAASKLVDAIAIHFLSLAEYRAALGVPYEEVRRALLGQP